MFRYLIGNIGGKDFANLDIVAEDKGQTNPKFIKDMRQISQRSYRRRLRSADSANSRSELTE